jgi:hypothetical protein
MHQTYHDPCIPTVWNDGSRYPQVQAVDIGVELSSSYPWTLGNMRLALRLAERYDMEDVYIQQVLG